MAEDTDPLAQRKTLSFEQAEAGAPLPQQLKRREISKQFRVILWDELYLRLEDGKYRDTYEYVLLEPWQAILRSAWVLRDSKPSDEFPTDYHEIVSDLKTLILTGSWSTVLGWLEFVFKHPGCPDGFPEIVRHIMRGCKLAYDVVDDVVICPISSEAERASIQKAFVDLAAAEFHGARAHLRKAAEQLTAGHYSDSIRESIHAVEATARTVEPSGALSSALGKLEGKAKIHSAMKPKASFAVARRASAVAPNRT